MIISFELTEREYELLLETISEEDDKLREMEQETEQQEMYALYHQLVHGQVES